MAITETADGIRVKNWQLVRRWGWAYSTETKGAPWAVVSPDEPTYTGTLKQVREKVENDRNYQAAREANTVMQAVWFFDGRRIAHVRDSRAWHDGRVSSWLRSIDQMRQAGQELSKEIEILFERE